MKLRGRFLASLLALTASLLSGAASHLVANCGPFVDVTFFCSPILELYHLGITGGTSPITYAPDQTTTRGEIAAFIARSFNQTARRTSRRAALWHWSAPTSSAALGLTTLGSSPQVLVSDGADIWVATEDNGVSRVRASDGRFVEAWNGQVIGGAILVAMGRVFVAGGSPGRLFALDPRQPAGSLTEVAADLGSSPIGMTFDGARIWTVNYGNSVSVVTPGASLPWGVTTIAMGLHGLGGILFDGTNVWVSNFGEGALLKLDSSGEIVQTVEVGGGPTFPVFDGANIWVPNGQSNSVSVVRAATGALLATLTGNGLDSPGVAAFDGERVLVTNAGGTLSLWSAADLEPQGSLSTGPGTQPAGACSDGVNFWIALRSSWLARF